MGLFSRDKKKEAPEGWVTTDALVAADRGSRLGQASGPSTAVSYKYEISYEFLTEAGALVAVEDTDRLRTKEQPVPGDRVTIAYDPADPQQWVLLERESERTWRIVGRIQNWLEGGAEATVEVISAEPTGRVARTGFGDASVESETEFRLRMTATPASGAPFEVEMSYWEKPELVQPGTRGYYFYDAANPRRGMPTFPGPRHQNALVDPVGAAREEFIAQFAHLEIPKEFR